jgi:hypothetical protein
VIGALPDQTPEPVTVGIDESVAVDQKVGAVVVLVGVPAGRDRVFIGEHDRRDRPGYCRTTPRSGCDVKTARALACGWER